MEKEKNRTEYHKEWRKKNPKKNALIQLRYWKRKVAELTEQEEQEQKEVAMND